MDPSNPNVGIDFEGKTYLQLDQTYQLGTFLSPQRKTANGFEEICDVLAIPRRPSLPVEGIIIIQNKAAHTGPEAGLRTSTRFAANVAKHIRKGLAQAQGAVRILKSGEEIYSRDGIPLEEAAVRALNGLPTEEVSGIVPLNLNHVRAQVGHGLVVISSIEVEVDWKDVLVQLVEANQKHGFLFQVLDLVELQQMLHHSHGKSALFENLLVERFKLMLNHRNPCIRLRLRGPDNT